MKRGSTQVPWTALHKLRCFSLTLVHTCFSTPLSVTPVNCPYSPSAAHYLKPPPLFPKHQGVCRNTFPLLFHTNSNTHFVSVPCLSALITSMTIELFSPYSHYSQHFWPIWSLLPFFLAFLSGWVFCFKKIQTKKPKTKPQTNKHKIFCLGHLPSLPEKCISCGLWEAAFPSGQVA